MNTAKRTRKSEIELLESRITPSNAFIVDGIAVALTVSHVAAGTKIHFNVVDYSSTDDADINDPSDAEPLIIYSDSNPNIQSFDINTHGEFDYTAVAKDEKFFAVIQNGDNDEQATIYVNAPGVDLSAKINTDKVTPTNAKDLHLLSVFGHEHLNVPVDVTNLGMDEFKGKVNVQLYLSPTSSLDTNAVLLGKGTLVDSNGNATVDLKTGESASLHTDKIAVPASTKLVPGESYYLIAKIVAPSVKENDVDENKMDQNNISPSSSTFEFLGIAKTAYIPDKRDSVYFTVARQALSQVPPSPETAATITDPATFIPPLEANISHPYKDSQGIPTIGIGLALKDASPQVITDLVQDVRDFTGGTYDGKVLPADEAGVIDVLMKAAVKKNAPDAISVAQGESLFAEQLPDYIAKAENDFGGSLNSFTALQQTAIVDFVFNAGAMTPSAHPKHSGYPTLQGSLNDLDFVRAGFNLVNTLRATQVHIHRIAPEYYNLLVENVDKLGSILM